jgi:hypothetical protein
MKDISSPIYQKLSVVDKKKLCVEEIEICCHVGDYQHPYSPILVVLVIGKSFKVKVHGAGFYYFK